MKELLLEAHRQGYGTDQCGRTLTVGELINFLQDFDEETNIFISNDNGYTYGRICYEDFREKEEDEEDE